jgi:hypothetical protein
MPYQGSSGEHGMPLQYIRPIQPSHPFSAATPVLGVLFSPYPNTSDFPFLIFTFSLHSGHLSFLLSFFTNQLSQNMMTDNRPSIMHHLPLRLFPPLVSLLPPYSSSSPPSSFPPCASCPAISTITTLSSSSRPSSSSRHPKQLARPLHL